MLECSPWARATPPTLAPGWRHLASTSALKSLLYSRRRGRPSFEICSIVSTILQSWGRCPLLNSHSRWVDRTDTAIVAQAEHEPGWVEYDIVNPATGAVQTKMSYVMKIDDLYLGCGVYKSAALAA